MTPVPDVVQTQNADLAFKFMLSKPLKAGSWLKLSFPAETGMTVSKDVTGCKEQDQQFTIVKCEAHIEDNYLEFIIAEALVLDGATTAGYEIAASTAVNLPTTIARVDPISLSTEATEVRATVFTARAGTFTKAALKPVSDIVGSDTTLQVHLVTAHAVPKQGLLLIKVAAPWNDGAPGAAIPYFSAIQCSDFTIGGKKVPDAVYTCRFWDDGEGAAASGANRYRLEISGAFEDGVQADTEIKINIAGFRNPMSANEAFDVFQVETTGPNSLHIVDTVKASVTVSKAAALTGAVFRVARIEAATPDNSGKGIVQEQNVMELRFSSPVPLREGCQVSYWFPTAFYDAAQIVDVRTGALFAQTNEHHRPAKPASGALAASFAEPGALLGTQSIGSQFVLKEEAGGYKSVSFSSCTTFRGHEAPEVTRIRGLSQPRSTQPTPSVQVHITDIHGEPIASVTSGVTFTPVAGGLTIKRPTLDKSIVSSLASLSWTIIPDHALAAADAPSVTVKLPLDFVVQPNCELPPSKGAKPPSRKCSVDRITNSITIEQLISEDVQGGAELTFTTGPVRLPTTTSGGQGAFQITTYINEIALDGTASAAERYGVDTGAGEALVQLEPGAIRAPSATPSSSQAMALTEYTFSLTPQHRIPQYGLIMVQYPLQVEIEDSSLSQTLCRGEYTGKETEKALMADQKEWKNFPAGAAVCTIFAANRTLIVNKGFQTGQGGPGGTTTYSWVLPYVSNPSNLAVSDSFIVTTRDQFFSLIDEVKTGVTVQMTDAAEFRSASLTLGSYTNGAQTSYRFSLAAATSIKSSDYILVTFPDACQLPDDAAALACSSTTTAYIDKLTCTKRTHLIEGKLANVQSNVRTGKAVLVALTGIREIPALETFSFEIKMVMNPNSTRPTQPLRVQVFDSVALSKATHADSGGLVVITSTPWTVDSEDASITSSVQGAGLATVYTLTMSLKHDLAAGGGLLIRYPPQVIKKSINQKDNEVGKLTVRVDASDYGCPDALTSPEIDDSARQILFVAQSFSTPLIVEPKEATDGPEQKVERNKAAKAGTSSKNSATDGGSQAPNAPTGSGTAQKGAAKAQPSKSKQATPTKKKLKITIQGLGNPYNNEASSSFQIVTFNTEKKRSGTVLYFVDQVVDGLTVDSPCAYPCKECAPGDPSSCLACFSTSVKPLLQERTCLAECSDGRYFDAGTNRCELCDPTCLTCKGAAKTCTSCGGDEFLHLRGEECVKRCGDGYVDDPSNNLCLKCREGCSTCSVSPTNCTSCDMSSSTPWNFRFDCRAKCPAEIGIVKGTSCLECAPQCKTCAIEPDRCSTCEPHMRFDPLNRDCLEVCQAETQIYAPSPEEGKDGQKGVCQTCHENCQTCVGDVNTCTSCQPGFVLNLDSTCQTSCPKPQNLVKGGITKKALEQGGQSRYQTAVEGICKECEVPCLRCHDQADACTACTKDFLLYKGTCIDHCPDKYWNETVIGRDNEPVNQCVLVGLICPEGFHVNDAGEGCVPNEFECKDGYEINEKRTACIPAPGSPVPFPFLFTAICMGLVVAGSYMKEREGTKIFTCLIFLISSMELLEYLLIAIFAALLEEVFASLLAFVAVSVLVATNIVFSIGYRKYTMNDRGYVDWIRLFPKTRMLVPIVCTLVNFTSVRFVFSGFFGLENCLATFHEPRTSVHKHLQTLTYVKYVFVYIPIFLADLIIFFAVGWGHQLLVLAIETFLLQLFMIFLTYKEFQDPAKLYADAEGEYSQLKPRKNGQIAVMGAFEDEGMDETHLIRQDKGGSEYEIALRKKALTAILQQVGENFFTSQKKGVDIGGQISKVFTKFDSNQLKLRRAFSLEDLSAEPTNGTDGTIEDEESDESIDSLGGAALVRRHSFPMLGGIEDDVADPFFREQLDKIKEAVLEDAQKDNVYAEVKQEMGKTQHQKKKKLVNRRTQTYLRELLQLDGEDMQDSDMEIVMEEEAEIDDQYTKGIIKDVIEGLSETSHRDEPGAKKKKGRRGQEPSRPIPDFEFADIMGEFEIDDAGNYIILRGDAGELLDRNERPVNKRGYLVDKLGNVVNTKQEIILMASELDSDEEIPASYGFEKRKQTLLNMSNDQQFKVNTYGQGAGKELQADEESQDDEEIVERQFKQLKQEGEASGDEGSQIEEPLAGDQNFMVDEHGNIDDMIDIITRKTVPVKKENLKQHRAAASPGGESRASSSRPPQRQRNTAAGKRFRPIDQIYFPGDQPSQGQQQKLFQIAESIGGFASQVADNMTGGNLDISEIRRSQKGEPGDANYQARAGAKQRDSFTNEPLSGKRAPAAIVTSDFYAGGNTSGANPDGTQSVLSQDIVFMHEALAARPGGRPGQQVAQDFSGQAQPGQLRKVYGTIRADQSPKRAASKGKADGSGARLFSADPRLRGLENIYLSKFSHVGSQRNVGLKKPFQMKKSLRGAQAYGRTGTDQQRQAVVAETLERLEQAQSMGGPGAPPAHARAHFGNSASFAHHPARRADAGALADSQSGRSLTPVRAQNWLGADATDERNQEAQD